MNNIDSYKIFSESNCVSREMLWDYSQNTLSDAQKLEVEQHLTDCELCSEALEGFALMAGTAGLDETVNEVQKLTETRQAPVKQISGRNTLLAAASVAALLLFGAIALNLLTNTTEEKAVVQKVSIPPQQENNKRAAAASEPVINSDERVQSTPADPVSVGSVANESEFNTQVPAKPEEKSTDLSFTTKDAEAAPQADALSETTVANEQPLNDGTREVSTVTGTANTQKPNVLFKQQSSLPTNRVDNNNNTFTGNASNWSLNEADDKAEAERKLAARNQGVINIEGLRVYDYTGEYSEKLKSEKLENGVEAQYKDRDEKKKAKSSQEKEKVALTYRDALQTGLRHFKNKRYTDAIQLMNVIRSSHPDNVNAIFYTALCYEETGDYPKALAELSLIGNSTNKTFDQESEWHRAVINEKTGNHEEAKKMYRKIVADGGFYKDQAILKLNGLK